VKNQVDKHYYHIIFCDIAKPPSKFKKWPNSHLHHLYFSGKQQNIAIGLPHFIKNVNCHFSHRVKDLLEIAGYVYAADRMISRGSTQQLEFQNWSRNLKFHIKVRDINFWNASKTKERLCSFLEFVSGDKNYEFNFYPGGKDIGQLSLFDNEKIELERKDNSSVALFSGGLDSFAGAIKALETNSTSLIIVGHRSSVPLVKKIQLAVKDKLIETYGNRINYLPFDCSLTGGNRAVEETQRTRIFLYTSIALAVAVNTTKKEIQVFENGITSINFSKRQDLINARASRTTHPKTLSLLQDFFDDVTNDSVKILHPFLFNTKSDIIETIQYYKKERLLSLTLSCTKTFDRFKNRTGATHCGGCSQCIDRRLAAYANNLENYDAIYDCEISEDEITNQEGRTHLISYLKFATDSSLSNENDFLRTYANELSDLIPFIPGKDELAKIQSIFKLYHKHSNQILKAISRIRQKEDITKPKKRNTIYNILDDRLHLRNPIELITEDISAKLKVVIPKAFEHRRPNHENELNDVINAFVDSEDGNYKREYPSIRFSFSNIVTDHSIESDDLIIEAKMIRKTDARSKITNELAADLFKLPSELNKLFIIYDPDRRIADDEGFKRDFEKHKNIFFEIIR